jgi:hypothetical protein
MPELIFPERWKWQGIKSKLAGMNGMFLYAVLVITPKIPGFEPSLFSGSETVF